MTVYVDDARIPARVGRVSGAWSHLFVGPWDDPGDLHRLAAAIGLRRSWYQDRPWPRGHYDVTEPRRQASLAPWRFRQNHQPPPAHWRCPPGGSVPSPCASRGPPP